MTDIPIYRAALGGLGPWELAIILVIVLIVFGAGKLPKIGSSIGEALKNFKKSVNEKPSDKKPDESPNKSDDESDKDVDKDT